MDVLQIALFGLAAVILAMTLKQVKGEWGFFISFAAAAIIAIYLIGYMEQVFGVIRQWNQYLNGISDYMLILSKALGITYICEFTTGICKDAGYITIGNQIELCGKIAVLMLGMPILLALLQTIEGGFFGMNETLLGEMDFSALNQLFEKLFPDSNASFTGIVMQLMSGNFEVTMSMIKNAARNTFLPGIMESKNLFLIILLLGILSVLLSNVMGLFENKQVADIAYYLVYLFLMILLLKGFDQILQTGKQAMENCRDFMKALIPAYCLSINLAIGSVSAISYYQFSLILVFIAETVFLKICFPLSQTYVLLAVLNGIDQKARFTELIKLIDKTVSVSSKFIVAAALSGGLIQSMVTSEVDQVQKTVIQKAVSAIPGIGDLSDSVTDIFLGSAALLKNTIGAAALLCLCFIVLVPMIKILLISMSMKASGALIGMLGDSKMADSVARTGDGGFLILKLTLSGMLLFFVSIAVITSAMKGGG